MMHRFLLAVAAPALAVAVLPAEAAHATPAEPYRNTCNPARASLPASVVGQPSAFGPGSPTGAYVWHDGTGWKLRVSHNQLSSSGTNGVIEVGGRIAASRPLARVRAVQLEPQQAGEWVAVQRPKRKVLTFRFVNGGYVDGINFQAGCAGRVNVNVWQVVRTTAGNVRQPLPVFVGAAATPVEQAGDIVRTPATDATRITILRRPVS